MSNPYIDEYLVIDTKEVLKRKLISSYVRTILGVACLCVVAFLIFKAFEERSAIYSMVAMMVAILSFVVMIGVKPDGKTIGGAILGLILHEREYWPTTTIHDNATKRARVAAAHRAVQSNQDLGPVIFRMRRRLKILLYTRLLVAVGIVMIWVALRWLEDYSINAAHFERYGTYQAVNVYVELDGTRTVTIDPDSPPGSVSMRREQPPTRPKPRPAPVVPEPLEAATPIIEAPIIPPNPPLPSYWPEVTFGYTQTINIPTPSGWLSEIRVQYPDGKMYAVGP